MYVKVSIFWLDQETGTCRKMYMYMYKDTQAAILIKFTSLVVIVGNGCI